ncbi:conserved hypothetical protein [Desulfosarcina cetonica]|uniref:DUF4037 domain-containing protein n=1 Tax=Desulfosarcina cetonica TaxID=90730 RepID=UPI0006D1E52B|nr:DUF4037 domain-containing protein [Desulfosarcina cetonica]VTR63740.1 conserved hypothetical protein [Desulfosarcina cetonica]
MKGLSLCEAYFRVHGMPMLDGGFADLKDRIAAGLVGHGSECFGYDDDISRDHDWGPGFILWLDAADDTIFGDFLRKAYDALPRHFKGYARMESAWGQNRVGVMEIGEFYKTYIGTADAPTDAMRWLLIPEENLAACTNGRVFHDGDGKFTAIRQALLAYYPEDVRLKRIAGRLMSAAQSGQYNLSRCGKRGAVFAARYARVHFCDDAMRLAFLLNRRYCPFYKWREKALPSLPILGAWLSTEIRHLLQTPDPGQMETHVERICGWIIEELRTQGLSDSDSDFLLDHGPIVQSRIRDPRIRELTVWYAGA